MPPDPSADAALDAGHLARQTFGDRALERELLELFEAQCGRVMAVLAGAGELRDKADAAHTLKGAARAVGAWRVALAAERLESGLAAGAEPARSGLEDLGRAIDETRRAAAALAA
jgi:HPt (histidine-containing phosphotransfer) domain-containing protein